MRISKRPTLEPTLLDYSKDGRVLFYTVSGVLNEWSPSLTPSLLVGDCQNKQCPHHSLNNPDKGKE